MYRAIVGLLIVGVVFGLGLAIFAEAVLEIRQIAFLGLAMALLGIAIQAFHIAIGHLADRRAKVAATETIKRDCKRPAGRAAECDAQRPACGMIAHRRHNLDR